MAGPGAVPPNYVLPGPNPLARPNSGWSPLLAGRGPGGWTPPVANHRWDRPAANLIAGRNTTINAGNALVNDRRNSPWRGYYGWRHDYPPFVWGSYYSSYCFSPYYYPYYSYYPSDSGSSSSYGSSSYGSSSYGDSYRPSGSQTDSGASGSSQPASSSPATSEEGAAQSGKETTAVVRCMDLARQAFQEGDYAEAQMECERAIRLLPGDANLHQFRALCQFAQGKYQAAAATLHEVLADGPGWDWDTLSSFYPSAPTYTTQLRTLEQSVKENPEDAAGRFVLAYHYLVLGERDAAVEQLQEVVKLQPRDRVATTILEALTRANKGKDGAPAEKPTPGR